MGRFTLDDILGAICIAIIMLGAPVVLPLVLP